MGQVHALAHPLIQHKISLMRDRKTGTKELRELVSEVAMLMAYEVTRNLPLKQVEIETPIGKSLTPVISGKILGIVPLLRGGLAMADGVLQLVPAAKVGHIGVFRDPATMQPVEYYCKLPTDIDLRELIVLDPLLATGATTSAAIQTIKDKGGSMIKLMCLIAAPEGIERIKKDHPDVDIFVGTIDMGVDEDGYIVPGLGDVGDRVFGTK